MEPVEIQAPSGAAIAVKLTLESHNNYEIHRFEVAPTLAALLEEIEKVC
jgi:hypothetical protein